MGHHNPQHGKLGIIDPEAGRDENEGVMFVAPVRKPEAERIDSYGQFTDQFQHPFPLNETEFLISYTPLGYHIGHPMEFGIYWMNWKRVISGVLAAAMLFALPVQLPVSAESLPNP